MVRQNSPKNASNIEKAADYSGYSKEDLLKLIDLEMAKPEKKIDGDLVDAYVKAALLKDQDTLPAFEAAMPQPGSRVIKLKSARRKRKKRALIALAACISVLIVVFLTPISSYAFNFSIIDTLATWYRDKVTVKPGNMTSSQQKVYTEEEVRQKLADEGISKVLLPHYEVDKYKITYIQTKCTDLSVDVYLLYKYKNNEIAINLMAYKEISGLTNVDLHGKYPNGKEMIINNRTVLWIAYKDKNHITFVDGLVYYDIIVPFEWETAKRLVETIY